MSAWIVSKNHIDVLITAALAWELVVQEQADEKGRIWKQCHASVAYRYDDAEDGDLPGPWGLDKQRPGPPGLTLADIEAYVFTPIEGVVDPEIVYHAVRSLDYQSCEHPGWESSDARTLARQIEQAAESMAEGHRQRYGEVSYHDLAHGEHGAWSADSPRIFLAAMELRTGVVATPRS